MKGRLGTVIYWKKETVHCTYRAEHTWIENWDRWREPNENSNLIMFMHVWYSLETYPDQKKKSDEQKQNENAIETLNFIVIVGCRYQCLKWKSECNNFFKRQKHLRFHVVPDQTLSTQKEAYNSRNCFKSIERIILSFFYEYWIHAAEIEKNSFFVFAQLRLYIDIGNFWRESMENNYSQRWTFLKWRILFSSARIDFDSTHLTVFIFEIWIHWMKWNFLLWNCAPFHLNEKNNKTTKCLHKMDHFAEIKLFKFPNKNFLKY